MCVAIIVPQGKTLPSDETLYRCFRSNPDGGGFAWADGKVVHFRKGFMEPERMLRELRKSVPEGATCLIHFRIGTHGGDGPEFTHPFPVSPRLKDMYMLAGSTKGRVLIHNGVMTGLGKAGVMSDTQDFTLRLATGATTLEKAKGWNKVATLSADGTVLKVGEWEESEGVLYSNDSYVPYENKWSVGCRKSRNSFVGLRRLKDSVVPVELPDGDTMSVGQLMEKKYPGAEGLFADSAENVYVGLPGYARPVCIGVMAFDYSTTRTPLADSRKSWKPEAVVSRSVCVTADNGVDDGSSTALGGLTLRTTALSTPRTNPRNSMAAQGPGLSDPWCW